MLMDLSETSVLIINKLAYTYLDGFKQQTAGDLYERDRFFL